MAERKKQENRKSSLDVIEARIEKSKEKVVKTKAAYDTAVKELKNLMDKRDLMRQESLMKLLTTSKRSYEEIETFLKSEPSETH